jgi:hypothetical protein
MRLPRSWIRRTSLWGTDRRPHILFYIAGVLAGIVGVLSCDWRAGSALTGLGAGLVLGIVLMFPFLTGLREIIDEQSHETGDQRARIPKATAWRLSPLGTVVSWLVVIAAATVTILSVWRRLR